MQPTSSEVYLDGKSVDFITANLKKQGGTTATGFDFVLPKEDASFRKFWNKEVLFFINKSDSYPAFRGRVISTVAAGDREVQFQCADALGFLTGNYKAEVTLDNSKNIDGLTPGASVKKLIAIANLQDIIGTDMLGETNPIIQMDVLRGTYSIMDIIKKILKEVLTGDSTPRENIIRVVDDGNKSQLVFETKKDVDTVQPVKTYTYDDNIISFKVTDRKIPTTVIVQGDIGIRATFRHSSAASAFGENFITVVNNQLKSRAACMDWGQKVYNANLNTQFEYILDTFDGLYLEPNDVIKIIDDKTDTSGNYTVVGKSISCGANTFRLQLTINKRPPILSTFIV
jgi:hypothetical protein